MTDPVQQKMFQFLPVIFTFFFLWFPAGLTLYWFINNLFTNFINLSGDRHFSEDEAVLAGFAQFEGRSVLVIGQEKGEDLDSRLKRNFGMMRPEGYRKCIRLMKLADKFNIPIIIFIFRILKSLVNSIFSIEPKFNIFGS